jgi:DNA-directed RNA polymerase specialized sigma24 family protein
MRPRPRDDDCTNPSIFLRLNASDAGPREIAWNDFARRYGPIIAGFAYRVGARTQDVDDVVQDVMLGFFSTVPTFTYDPSKGRFRRYLKVCTVRAVCRRFDKIAKLKSVPLSSLDEQALEIEQVWNGRTAAATFRYLRYRAAYSRHSTSCCPEQPWLSSRLPSTRQCPQ